MKVSIRKIISVVIILVLIILIMPKGDMSNFTFVEILLFSLIGFICIKDISFELSQHSYSLRMIHYIFILFFFVFSPIIQIYYSFRPWGLQLDSQNVEIICGCILLWIVFYNLSYSFFKNKTFKKINNFGIIAKISFIYLLAFTILSFVCTIFIIRNVGLSQLFARSTSYLVFSGSNSQTKTLLFDSVTKVTILFSTTISIINYYENKNGLLFVLINSFMLIITCFPTGLTRNATGIIYLGLLLIINYNFLKNKTKSSFFYFFIFIIGFVLVFPAINVFRTKTFSDANFFDKMNQLSSNISLNYNSEDYDAFSMIIQTKKYVSNFGITYGKQLFGNLLFFIPRNFWPNKPVGSGSMIFDAYNYSFTNVSCPLIAEGYINFGGIGIIIYALVLGYITSRLDYYYWFIMRKTKNNYCYLTIIYPYLLPILFFMLRGDFLSTFSYSCSYIFLFYIYLIPITKKVSINE